MVETQTLTVTATDNPILEGFEAADPHVVMHGHRYYLYATVAGQTETGFSVWSSPDLQEWRYDGMALSLKDVAWAAELNDDWAPAVAERNGRFYLYFCAQSRIGVAVADEPTGPFIECRGEPLVPFLPDLSSIDPMAFVDDDGQAYLYWGAVPGFWLEEALREQGFSLKMSLSVAPLNRDMTSFCGPERETVAIDRVGAAWHAFDHMEAQFVFKRGGVYYLMWSRGSHGRHEDDMAYHLVYATAPSPLGPWTRNGDRPVLSNRADIEVLAPGHHSILQVPGTDEWLCFYHYHRGPATWRDGREFDPVRSLAIDRMRFDAEGAIEPVVPTREGVGALPIPLALTFATPGPLRRGETREIVATSQEPVETWEFYANEMRVGISETSSEAQNGLWRAAWMLQGLEAGFYKLWARAQTTNGAWLQSAPLHLDVEAQ